MSEERAAASETVDPTAISLAMSGASRANADAYLDDQRTHLHEQLKQIHLDIFEKWLGVALRLATLCVGLGAATGVWLMISDAMHADGLRVEPFSVPPAMAERGLTGEVVAARVIDRLSELQAQTNTGRPARTYSNSWGNKQIKLEIPETGVSLGEVDTWLRAKLGHETPLTGEVVRSESGVTLTARAGADGAVSVHGSEADMEALTGKLAEAAYRLTQPYRYAIYLFRHESRPADAAPIFKELALHGGPGERQWAYNMWAATTEIATHDDDLALRLFQQAHKADPDAGQPIPTLASRLWAVGRFEESLQIRKEWAAKARNANLSPNIGQRDPGDYSGDLASALERARSSPRGVSRSVLVGSLVEAENNAHELSAARADLTELSPDVEADPVEKMGIELQLDLNAEDWRGVVAHAGEIATFLKTYPHSHPSVLAEPTPLLALAQAHLGDLAAAERTIAPTPADCYPCLIARAQIAEVAGQRAQADGWFARAVAAGPSLPFAFHDWGRALQARSQADVAIAKFAQAMKLSTHYPDALEGWGEALMAKNQSHLALVKFAEADKYAPNWGRLHLKWGEALYYAGKRDDANAQFARAAQLDLTPSEKSELARHP